MTINNNWNDWRRNCLYIAKDNNLEEYMFISARTQPSESWSEETPQTPLVLALKNRAMGLKRRGVTRDMVFVDVVLRCLSPLRQRAQLAYSYRGVNDHTQNFPRGECHCGLICSLLLLLVYSSSLFGHV